MKKSNGEIKKRKQNRRVRYEDVNNFKAGYLVKGKEYDVNFYDFPPHIRIRLAIKGLKMLLGISANPDNLLEHLKQGVFPNDRKAKKHPLYVLAVAHHRNCNPEEAEQYLHNLPHDDKRKLMQSKEIKRIKLLLQAKMLEMESGDQGH